jgi:integrase
LSENREVYRTGRDSLTPDEVERLLRAVLSYQEDVLLRVAIATGIRREDLVALTLEGVNAETGAIRFYESKKKRTRTVVVGGETLLALRRHVHELPAGTRYLFPSREQGVKHLSGKTAWNVLHRALERAGLKPRPFHALRATCIKLAQKKGWTPEQVSELTGDTIRTIQVHYSTPSHDEMAAVAREKAIL